ncbi:serine hydrolase domain-containing protein [Microbulbifer pacificus]|uniref:serine hydrolase domain-containing protein n=1 Tax=Microbulbifer pacificus TaxID=407164 RepID=UPI00131A3C3E|nr:serine hydrolase [Microbulbifer pacificus]
MSAKLANSARHISKFSDDCIHKDLLSYSPLFFLVRVRHKGNITSASLLNFATVQARFCPTRGAQLDSELLEMASPGINSENSKKFRHARNNANVDPVIQALLVAQLEEDNRLGLDTRALLVIREGERIAAAYGAGITPQTRLLGWSMSKSLLAILWGRMETLGLADTEQSRLFPEWEEDDRSAITLKHLLQMCDGLAFDETYRPGSDATRMLFDITCNDLLRYAPSRYALNRRLIHNPGTHFSYSSGTTNLLARWMHRRLGGTHGASTFLNREFLAPLGLRRTFFEMDSEGVFIGSSYTYASAEDWGKLGALMVNDGRAGPKRILSSDWIKRATEPNTSANDPRYGFQFWLNSDGALPPMFPELPADSYFMLGNREQKLMLAPSQNTVIVRLGWSSRPYPIEQRFGEILAQLPSS